MVRLDDGSIFYEKTGGVFYDCTLEQVEVIVKGLTPNYQHSNLSYTFSDQYFNYCVRKELNKCRDSLTSIPSTTTLPTEQLSPTPSEESGKSESNTDKAF